MTDADQALPPDPDDRQAPLPLWREVRAFLCTLFSVFGEPQELAPRTLTLKQHQLIAPWIRAGEALLRRFLFLEAAIILKDEGVSPPPARGRLGGGSFGQSAPTPTDRTRSRSPRNLARLVQDASRPSAHRRAQNRDPERRLRCGARWLGQRCERLALGLAAGGALRSLAARL
jgi:hypothetical protein